MKTTMIMAVLFLSLATYANNGIAQETQNDSAQSTRKYRFEPERG